MRKGDISNELPQRIIVTTNVFLFSELKLKKKLKLIPYVERDTKIKQEILSYLYTKGFHKNYNFELASYDMNGEELELLTEQLDKMGTNPFRYYSSYESVNHLVSELPYRPEVVGVLDIQARQLRYGHWGLDQL